MQATKNKLPEIILASSSKTRKELFSHVGIPFTAYPSNFVENMTRQKGESFPDVAKRLALGKAQDVAIRFTDALVIGADSFAVCNDIAIGKPRTFEKAIIDLQLLQGTNHMFYAGMVIIDTKNNKTISDIACAKVTFKKISRNEIEQYVAREDVRNIGGSYMISRLGSTLIEKIEGDYYAIVGISPSKLYDMFEKLGYNFYDYIKHGVDNK